MSAPLVRNHSLPTRAQQQVRPNPDGVDPASEGDEPAKRAARARSVDATKGLAISFDGLSMATASSSTPSSPRLMTNKPLAPPPRSKARPAPTPATTTPSSPVAEPAVTPPGSNHKACSSHDITHHTTTIHPVHHDASPHIVFSTSSSLDSLAEHATLDPALVRLPKSPTKLSHHQDDYPSSFSMVADDGAHVQQTPAWTVPSLPTPTNTAYNSPVVGSFPSPSASPSPSTWKFPTAAPPASPPSPARSTFTPLSPDLNPQGPLPKRRASSGIYTPPSYTPLGPAGRNSSAPSPRDQELAQQALRPTLQANARRKSSGFGLGLGGLGLGLPGSSASPASPTSPVAPPPATGGGFLARGRSYFGASAAMLASLSSGSAASPTAATTATSPMSGTLSPTGVYTPASFNQPTPARQATSPGAAGGAAGRNHQNLALHLPLSARSPASSTPLTSPPLPVLARKPVPGSPGTATTKRKPVPSAAVGSSEVVRSASVGSAASASEEDVKTPGLGAVAGGAGGLGGKEMRTLEVDRVEVEGGEERMMRVW